MCFCRPMLEGTVSCLYEEESAEQVGLPGGWRSRVTGAKAAPHDVSSWPWQSFFRGFSDFSKVSGVLCWEPWAVLSSSSSLSQGAELSRRHSRVWVRTIVDVDSPSPYTCVRQDLIISCCVYKLAGLLGSPTTPSLTVGTLELQLCLQHSAFQMWPRVQDGFIGG